MKRFLTAILINLTAATLAPACVYEAPTHNAYMFSVYSRESLGAPFAHDMNKYWKRYADDIFSTDDNYYRNHSDEISALAKQRGDTQMTEYIRLLDAYLEVSDNIGRDAWSYPTKQELAARDSTLRTILEDAQKYNGHKMRPEYALLVMRANMLLGRDKANMLYWTSTASKLPEGVYRDMARNIYARAMLKNGLTRQACDIYAEQGDMQSIKWCMRKHRNLAGIRKMYADTPDSPTLTYLVQDFVNNVQETIDTSPADSTDIEWMKIIGAQTVFRDEAKDFVAFADKVIADKKTSRPCLWQSAAAMVQYLLGDEENASIRIKEAVKMKGTERMKDNARCIRLLIEASAVALDGSSAAWLKNEFRWLDAKIKEERDNSEFYANHYTDVKERIVYRVLAPRYFAIGRVDMLLALYGMMEENEIHFNTSGNHASKSVSLYDNLAWNIDYNATNEYFNALDSCPADTIIAYYTFLTSAKNDVFEHYVASQVYTRKEFYDDLIGTKLIAEGRFADALTYLERVPVSFLADQNICWYMANRDFTIPRWYLRQKQGTNDCDGPRLATPARNAKADFCNDIIRLTAEHDLTREGIMRDSLAYAIAVRYYQASCYGDCWFITHYGKSYADSTRSGELDFAAKAAEYLTECTRSSSLQMQRDALYALASIGTDPWYTEEYDNDYNLVTIIQPNSAQYKALTALNDFALRNPQAVDARITKCDILKRFRKAAKR